MDFVKINTDKTVSLSLPSDPDGLYVEVFLYHELGDLVSGPDQATRIESGNYSITYSSSPSGDYVLNSSGKYRADFVFNISNVQYTRPVYFNVYRPYTNDSSFFHEYPELETAHPANFESAEFKVRNIINTYCGQSFDLFLNKTILLNGTGGTSLHLPVPVNRLKRVIVRSYSEDTLLFDENDINSRSIEKVHQPFNFDSSYYIRFKKGALSNRSGEIISAKFNENYSYSIFGDWGWVEVPYQVTQAANLLIADTFNADSEYRRHGVYEVDMDILKLKMGQDFFSSTGNIEADTLLMDFTLFVMDYII